MNIINSVLGDTLQGVFEAAAKWAATGAIWMVGQVGRLMSATTTVDLGSAWFGQHERVMAALSAALVLPMACCGVILAVYRQDASVLVRSFLVKLPLALLCTGVAVELVRLGLALTDDLSSYVLSAGGTDTTNLLTSVVRTLASRALFSTVPAFVVFVGALLLAVGALVLWLELVVRAAAVAAATLFLPLALAGLVWPATAHWCRRLGDTIAALVLSKLAVAAVLSLAAGALSGGASGLSSGDTSGGFAALVVGIALLALATTAPFMLLRLVPAIEAGAVMHLESARRHLQHVATAPKRGFDVAMEMAQGAGLLGTAGSGSSGEPSPDGGAPPVGPLPGDDGVDLTRGEHPDSPGGSPAPGPGPGGGGPIDVPAGDDPLDGAPDDGTPAGASVLVGTSGAAPSIEGFGGDDGR